MANRYSQTFSLTDIFNNKNLRGKLPLINYKETRNEDGSLRTRTGAKTVNRLIFDTAQSAANRLYKPLKATRDGDVMTLGGTLVVSHDQAVDTVYNAIKANEWLIKLTANNMDMIRGALKEAEKNNRTSGIQSKLYLRVQSMQQIEAMSRPQLQALMSDVMENIAYGDDFPKTKEKWNVEEIPVNSPYNYEQRQLRWKNKVGA